MMKLLRIFILFVLGSFAANAQDIPQKAVPTEAVSSFENEYSSANDVEWEKSGDNFKVEFELNRMDYEILYSGSGKMMKLERQIEKDNLPASVKKTLKNEYAEFQVEDAEMRKEGNSTSYKVDMKNGMKEMDILFDASGKILRKWGD